MQVVWDAERSVIERNQSPEKAVGLSGLSLAVNKGGTAVNPVPWDGVVCFLTGRIRCSDG